MTPGSRDTLWFPGRPEASEARHGGHPRGCRLRPSPTAACAERHAAVRRHGTPQKTDVKNSKKAPFLRFPADGSSAHTPVRSRAHATRAARGHAAAVARGCPFAAAEGTEPRRPAPQTQTLHQTVPWSLGRPRTAGTNNGSSPGRWAAARPTPAPRRAGAPRSPPPARRGRPGPASLTSSAGVDGHFLRGQPQLSRLPVCRVRVPACSSRARTPSVPMGKPGAATATELPAAPGSAAPWLSTNNGAGAGRAFQPPRSHGARTMGGGGGPSAGRSAPAGLRVPRQHRPEIPPRACALTSRSSAP